MFSMPARCSWSINSITGADTVKEAVQPHANSEINITPFIDVLLVLIVIFLAALPLGQRGLDINLPLETQGAQQANTDSSQILLEFTADRRISVNQQPMNMATLQNELRSIFETRREKTMFIAGAGSLTYGEIIDVIDAARGAGVEKVGIVTEGMRRAAGAAPVG